MGEVGGIREITGGADAEVAAAIAVVAHHLIEQELAVRSRPPSSPRPSPWVLAGRPRDMAPPLPSATYDAQPWAFDVEAGGDEPA